MPGMSLPKRGLLWVMGIFYIWNGGVHLANPAFYLPMMPSYLPAPLELVYLSGLAEIGLGFAVLLPRTRRLAAWGLILLLIAVFPANIHVALRNVPFGGAEQGWGIWNWVRLPFQAVFLAWAWWYTRPGQGRDLPWGEVAPGSASLESPGSPG